MNQYKKYHKQRTINLSGDTIKKISIGFILVILVFIMMVWLSGCASFQSGIHDLKGSIVGNEYIIDTFDNFGNRTLKTHGEQIDIDNNIVEEKTYNSDGWGTVKTLSAVITITIDGHQMISCGDTCIFYDTRLQPEYEFYLDNIESESDSITDATYIAGRVNAVKNLFGKSMVVIIKSQTGAPIYAFSGDKVYWEVPNDLPKFTKLMIDGKALYIHRANFQVIDKALLD